jgi:putative transposase
MALPRSKYVREGQEGTYHCFSRCVRRAFLYGYDALTRRDFSHRKLWLVDRLRYLAAIFAMEVCAYAIMENHYHTILRTRPDIVASWSDREVAIRWLTLCPGRNSRKGVAGPPSEKEICCLVDCPECITELRRRLCSLSWFMGRLNEFIARAANKEDGVKGRFWEGRFKCQALLDEAAIAACMVYVDLNLIRAGIAHSPEESNFTSIQERIRGWLKETSGFVPSESPQSISSTSIGGNMQKLEDVSDISNPISELSYADFLEAEAASACWLCPIQSDFRRRGILQMTEIEYFDLVDRSGRILRGDKRGVIDVNLAPILSRIGANPQAWLDTISHFGLKFRLVAGMLHNMRNFAYGIGRRWLTGITTARVAFSTPPSQLS